MRTRSEVEGGRRESKRLGNDIKICETEAERRGKGDKVRGEL